MSRRSYRRGYAVALLIGLEENHAVIWQVYSQVAKHQQSILLTGERKDQKATYNFHESIVDAMRPKLREGVKSILLASPPKTSYGQDFQNHIAAHHAWLLQGPNKATIAQMTGLASTLAQVAALTRTDAYKDLIQENAAQETENLLEILERRLSKTDDLVLFSLEEAEKLILCARTPGKPYPEYLLLTDTYLTGTRHKVRLHRLMQIAENKKVKTRVITAESNAGKRVTQLGGIVCLANV
jgi:stalled ribosome rescue protein Dom34